MSLSRASKAENWGTRVIIMPNSMPEARTRPSSSVSRIRFSRGVMSIRKFFAFSTRKGIRSRLRETMRSTVNSSPSSVETIWFRRMVSHSFTATSRSPWATSAALIAPMDVP